MCVCVCVFQDQRWLCEVFECVRQQLYPLLDSSLGVSVVRLSLAVVSKVQRAVGSDLPVSYRCVCVCVCVCVRLAMKVWCSEATDINTIKHVCPIG